MMLKTSETLYAVMQQLLRDCTQSQAGLVEVLACPLHAELTRQKERLPHYIVTLHHLRRCLDYMVRVLDDYNSEQAIAHELRSFLYVPHLRSADERVTFIECVGQDIPDFAASCRIAIQKPLILRPCPTYHVAQICLSPHLSCPIF